MAEYKHKAKEPTIEATVAFLERFEKVKACDGWASSAVSDIPLVDSIIYRAAAPADATSSKAMILVSANVGSSSIAAKSIATTPKTK